MESFEDRLEQSKSYKNFRTGLDLGMGAMYTVIGIGVMYAKYFNVVELPDTFSYILGGLMVLYGMFRVYRGLMVVLPKKNKIGSSRA